MRRVIILLHCPASLTKRGTETTVWGAAGRRGEKKLSVMTVMQLPRNWERNHYDDFPLTRARGPSASESETPLLNPASVASVKISRSPVIGVFTTWTTWRIDELDVSYLRRNCFIFLARAPLMVFSFFFYCEFGTIFQCLGDNAIVRWKKNLVKLWGAFFEILLPIVIVIKHLMIIVIVITKYLIYRRFSNYYKYLKKIKLFRYHYLYV